MRVRFCFYNSAENISFSPGDIAFLHSELQNNELVSGFATVKHTDCTFVTIGIPQFHDVRFVLDTIYQTGDLVGATAISLDLYPRVELTPTWTKLDVFSYNLEYFSGLFFKGPRGDWLEQYISGTSYGLFDVFPEDAKPWTYGDWKFFPLTPSVLPSPTSMTGGLFFASTSLDSISRTIVERWTENLPWYSNQYFEYLVHAWIMERPLLSSDENVNQLHEVLEAMGYQPVLLPGEPAFWTLTLLLEQYRTTGTSKLFDLLDISPGSQSVEKERERDFQVTYLLAWKHSQSSILVQCYEHHSVLLYSSIDIEQRYEVEEPEARLFQELSNRLKTDLHKVPIPEHWPNTYAEFTVTCQT
ncbi:MAG: hypothetical protein EP343_05545 [Deltaproteobacteria bacterium]|nr:MAG: hypothetical protein EP343_05545 [Deltaproteobacteria bacterium]